MKSTLTVAALAILGAILVTLATFAFKRPPAEIAHTPRQASAETSVTRLRIAMERIEGAGGRITATRALDLVSHAVRKVGPGGKLVRLEAPEGIDVDGKSDRWGLSFEVPLRKARVDVELRPCPSAVGGTDDLCAETQTGPLTADQESTYFPWAFRDTSRIVADLIRQGATLGEDGKTGALAAGNNAEGQAVWRLHGGGIETAFLAEHAAPPKFFVLQHSPGVRWEAGTSGMRQPGIQEHVDYWSGYWKNGTLESGGPFLDDTGGMMIVRAGSKEQALQLAEADPSVRSGLLRVDVRPWLAPLGGPSR